MNSKLSGHYNRVLFDYKKQMQLATKQFEDKMIDINMNTREIIVEELAKQTPVETGFLRNHITVSDTPIEITVIGNKDKTEESVAALTFKNLTYQAPPSRAEVLHALRNHKERNLKSVEIGFPVDYAKNLINNSKYSEFHRKAQIAAQQRVDKMIEG